MRRRPGRSTYSISSLALASESGRADRPSALVARSNYSHVPGVTSALRTVSGSRAISLSRSVRLLPTLLPIAQGSNRDVERHGEILLAQLRSPANGGDLWDARCRRPFVIGHGPGVGIGHGCSVALLGRHRVSAAPVNRRCRLTSSLHTGAA